MVGPELQSREQVRFRSPDGIIPRGHTLAVMDLVSPYRDVFSMPAENEERDLGNESQAIHDYFRQGFATGLPLGATISCGNHVINVEILEFVGFGMTAALFKCRIASKEMVLRMNNLKLESPNPETARFWEDALQVPKLCLRLPTTSVSKIVELSAQVQAIASRSLKDELSLTAEQSEQDNDIAFQLMRLKTVRGHWKRFGRLVPLDQISSLEASKLIAALSADGIDDLDQGEALHHLVSLALKPNLADLRVKFLPQWCSLQEGCNSWKVFDIPANPSFGFPTIDLQHESSALINVDLAEIDFTAAEAPELLQMTQTLPSLARLIEKSFPLDDSLVFRRDSLTNLMNDAISKALMLLESRGEDDFAAASQRILEWRSCHSSLTPIQCNHCGRESFDMQRCSKCKKATYCNRDCQLAHWKEGHKKSCK